ncbi:ABC transporter permease [Protaetiibacter intestinalis]|uniref:ABC transporter permease n=1 Tax=Protaetiibacter intestinalis TaxID=2419774 RepID=A0A387B697_9MICO|nr:ABC transporter permease [Protaetiibacter intestinalis]AYF97278.1 ABC transporter permease [Protaetiibacter intestinalis]
MSTLRLTALHTRYTLVETFRVPIAVIGSLAFPALAFLFFIVPQRVVADDPVFATQAVIQLMVFALMSNALFGFGISIAQARETPWDPYLRTLPAPAVARILAQVLSTGTLGLAALIPVLVLGATLTQAHADAAGLVLGLLALAASALPFLFAGIAIGYAMPMKVAIAVVQIVMFALAFGGGLFLPPVMFPGWLDVLSRFLPSRQAREVVIAAVQGGEVPWWAWGGILAWCAVLLTLALVLYRRDEGRRFR